MDKIKGTVKFFNHMKNYGFISGEDGQDYFVHGSAVSGTIDQGDSVEFVPEKGDRGLKAAQVSKV